uniref:NADH-ubiquinone oxidoreductase chain 2 n=1 Tax=Ombrastacoides huonensis TaxID=217112 RepID=A0A411ATQ1_9EUCA|nr:NADH dehydrogenase subunit 2 [Ombrastacoides huonensis]QAX91383.1 NADH dehydrogenase subunit 2 [Ombrastacoides huonensis]
MPYSPYKMSFFLALLSGSLLAISSTSWVSAWIGLELNLMSFIPLISSKSNSLPSEASLKYFLVQALGSAMIVLSSSLTLFWAPGSFFFISLALLLKLGAAPFHFWFPQVMEGLNWLQALLLLTVQKLAPMFLLSYLSLGASASATIFFSATLSAIIGALGGMNQTSLRKLLTFSSINHMSWMLFAMLINESSWLIYFSFYTLITSSAVLLFLSFQAYYFTHLLNANSPFFSKLISIMSLYSLGGLPPLSGFVPKWIIIQEMINCGSIFALLILLLSSLVTLYFYTRLTLSAISISASLTKWGLASSLPSYFYSSAPFFSFLNLFGLFIPSAAFLAL